MVTRIVSATEAKNRFGAVVKSALEQDEAVLVENHGAPYVFLVSPTEYERLQASDNELRRRKRLERLEEIMRVQAELNKDLTPEAAEELVQRSIEEDRAERSLRAVQS